MFLLQYISGRKKENIMALNHNTLYIDKYFVNQRPDASFKHSNITIKSSTFANIGFKKSEFRQSDLSHCTFISCYFNKTIFENVTMIGCRFIDCTFEGITLIGSDFRYASFKSCYIDFETMYPNLPHMPSYHNVRWKLCTNLAIEALSSGNSEEYRKYFFEEKKSCEKHYFEMFRKSSPYYRQKYNFWDSVSGIIKYSLSKVNKIIWGYGEKLSSLFTVLGLVIIFYTVLYKLSGSIYDDSYSVSRSLSIWESLYVSICNFITITPEFTSSTNLFRWYSASEGFLGVTLMGFFVAALFRYINRR